MQLFYNGTDITSRAGLTACICREGFGSSGDMLEIETANIRDWYRWAPQRDDEMEAVQGTYRTGKMYLNTMQKDGERMAPDCYEHEKQARRAGRARFTSRQALRTWLGPWNAAECG